MKLQQRENNIFLTAIFQRYIIVTSILYRCSKHVIMEIAKIYTQHAEQGLLHLENIERVDDISKCI